MKIIYLANIRFPSERAHATQIFQNCQSFCKHGCDLILFTNNIYNHKSDKSAGPSDLKNFFGSNPLFTWNILLPKKIYFKNKFGFLLREFIFIFHFWSKFKSEYGNSQTIIYSRDEWILAFLSFLLPKQRLVYESHEAKYNLAVRRLIKKQIPMIVISEGIKDFYKQKNVPLQQMLVAQDGIDESFFTPHVTKTQARKELNLDPSNFTVIYVGGFDKWKGVETFLRASTLSTDVKFVAIGGSESEISNLKKYYPRVIFLGRKPYTKLPIYQQAADVLVVPNSATTKLGSEYTSPLKLFAHMTSGVPVVASNVKSLTSVLGYSYPYLFEADDEESLLHVIKKIRADYNSAKLQAKKIMEKSEKFTWDKRVASIINFIK